MNKSYERRWVRYAKGGKMKYIGHLDLLKIFQLAIRRAKLPVAYSMGFNPHQRISFAMPLPVGMDSVCEYMEILLEDPDDMMALDCHLPDGLNILEVYEIPEKVPSPAAILMAADYRITCTDIKDINICNIQALQDAKEIIVTKKTKKGEAEADIKPDILSLEYDPVGAIDMRLSAGSVRNLNPNLVIQKIFQNPISNITILRQGLLAQTDKGPVPLHEATAN